MLIATCSQHISIFVPLMKNCIGAIDGTYVPITIEEDRAPPYRNRKGTLSQNVMVVCDFNLNFTFVSCGWEGTASDAGVLQFAINKGFSVPEGKCKENGPRAIWLNRFWCLMIITACGLMCLLVFMFVVHRMLKLLGLRH
jgi:hypothetical protein